MSGDIPPPPAGAPGSSGGESGSGNRAQAEEMLRRGLDYYDRENHDVALVFYEKAVAADPSFAMAHNNLGMVLIDLGRMDEAVNALKQTLKIDPNHAEAYNNLGFIYRREGNEAFAAACYLKFLELEPDIEDSERIRKWIEDVKAEVGQLPEIDLTGDVDAAFPPLGGADASSSTVPRNLAASDPGLASGGPSAKEQEPPPTIPMQKSPVATRQSPIGDLNIVPDIPRSTKGATGLVDSGGKIKKIKKMTQIEIFHEMERMEQDKERTRQQQEEPAEREKEESAERKVEESPEDTFERALDKFVEGDMQSVEEILKPILDKAPDYEPAVSLHGKIYIRNEDFDQGLEYLATAIQLNPDDYSNFYVLGFALRVLGQDSQAAEAYSMFLAGIPDAVDANKIAEWIARVTGASPPAPQESQPEKSAPQKTARPSFSQRPSFTKKPAPSPAPPEKEQAVEAPGPEPAAAADDISTGSGSETISSPVPTIEATALPTAPSVIPYAEVSEAGGAPPVHIRTVYEPEYFEDEETISDSDTKRFMNNLQQFQEGNIEGAKVQLLRFMDKHDSYAPAHVLFGRILMRSRQYEEATESFKRAIRLRPNYEEAYYFIGRSFEKRGLLADAKIYYEYCLVLDPSGPRSVRLREWLDEIEVDILKPNTVQCERCLRKVEARYVTDYEDKKTCRWCLENIEIETGRELVKEYFPELMARETADDAAANLISLGEFEGEAKSNIMLPVVIAVLVVIATIIAAVAITIFKKKPPEEPDVTQITNNGEPGAAKGVAVSQPAGPEISKTGEAAAEHPPGISVSATVTPPEAGSQEHPENTLNHSEPSPEVPSIASKLWRTKLNPYIKPPAVAWRGTTYKFRPEFYGLPENKDKRIVWSVRFDGDTPEGMKAAPIESGGVEFTWKVPGLDKKAPAAAYEFTAVIETTDKLRPKDGVLAGFKLPMKLVTNFKYVPDKEAVNPNLDDQWSMKIKHAQLLGGEARPLPDVIIYGGRFAEPDALAIIQTQVGKITAAPNKPTVLGKVTDVATFDMDGDGIDDCLALDWYLSRLCVFYNRFGTISRSPTTYPVPKGLHQLIPIDVNGDGLIDLVGPGIDPRKLHIAVHTPDGFPEWKEITDDSFAFTHGLMLRRCLLDDMDLNPPAKLDGVLVFSALANYAQLAFLVKDPANKTLKVAVTAGVIQTAGMPADVQSARLAWESLDEIGLPMPVVGQHGVLILTGGEHADLRAVADRGGFFQPFYGLDNQVVAEFDRPYPVSFAVHDFNRDGLDDIVVAWVDHIEIYWQTAGERRKDPDSGVEVLVHASFRKVFELDYESMTGEIDLADLDGDGVVEILCLMMRNRIGVLRAVQ